MNISIKKGVVALLLILLMSVSSNAQTLQQVTDNGANTTNMISANALILNSSSFAGPNVPNNINLLSGLRINGSMSSSSHNGITYQSGGGGAAAIGIFRNGSYQTLIDFYTNLENISGNMAHRMRIASNGFVGIGTTNPSYNLDIINHLRIGAQGGEDFTLIGGGNSVGSYISMRYADGSINNYLTGTNNSYLAATTGNVGIGTRTPTEKLSVNGNIRAKEVKVEATNWPDYIFKPGFKIRSLSETEKYIQANGHLPDIPSAQAAERNGIELGEMNKKLLQKIEELTLYMIEIDKKVSQLQAENKTLIDIISNY